jgi:heat shock protein 1/8
MKLSPFTVIVGDDENPIIQVDYKGERKKFAAEEISSMVLEKMKMTTEAYLNSDVDNVFITVPTYFSNSSRKSTRDATTIVGLNAMKIINEPTTAAIAYGFGTKDFRPRGRFCIDLNQRAPNSSKGALKKSRSAPPFLKRFRMIFL